MLDVAFAELPRSRSQHVLPRQFGLGDCERHHVLKLIAKAVRTSGLIEGRARPQSTRKRLVEQPAVEQYIHGAVRRLDLNRAE